MRRAAIVTLILAGLALAACGRDDDARGENDLFLRDAPDRPAPLRPAPDLDSLDPAPELGNARALLIEACVDAGRNGRGECACMADAASQQLDQDAYAYLRDRITGNRERAADRLEGLTAGEATEITSAAARIVMECGGSAE